MTRTYERITEFLDAINKSQANYHLTGLCIISIDDYEIALFGNVDIKYKDGMWSYRRSGEFYVSESLDEAISLDQADELAYDIQQAEEIAIVNPKSLENQV